MRRTNHVDGSHIQHVEQLSDDELHSQATQLAGIMLKHTAELIAHISVIANKQAFRPEYTSLFTYCMKELGLSETETHARTQVANVCRRFPQLLDSLGANRMSLTVAGKLAPHLNQENASTWGCGVVLCISGFWGEVPELALNAVFRAVSGEDGSWRLSYLSARGEWTRARRRNGAGFASAACSQLREIEERRRGEDELAGGKGTELRRTIEMGIAGAWVSRCRPRSTLGARGEVR